MHVAVKRSFQKPIKPLGDWCSWWRLQRSKNSLYPVLWKRKSLGICFFLKDTLNPMREISIDKKICTLLSSSHSLHICWNPDEHAPAAGIQRSCPQSHQGLQPTDLVRFATSSKHCLPWTGCISKPSLGESHHLFDFLKLLVICVLLSKARNADWASWP